ncbi:amidohydrolase [Saitoella complicata NRRL Y-17804]|uniref:amidohydrolase n=1 Tax=Saitoella complicata (strain BCRC 22490 / CBS 7301 / JCM 7358 / NBRC 10748 / NRRL Y-17804) TaxID=698492 RepID=UPI000866C8FB|nr:amidohydrolase [Saitoella complicata NRRL Y-17804]ODQ50072.1 amidohydrolase [Saitoella complicata NRRL Y-17804]
MSSLNLIPKTFTSTVRLALIQLATTADKSTNLARARKHVLEAASNGARIVVLPECFNSPYGTQHFPKYAEAHEEGADSYKALSEMAKEGGVYLVGGSIPEKEGDKLFNTSYSFSPSGTLLAKHRKLHLFDIDVPGKIRFQESEVLTGGDKFTSFTTEFGTIGVGICYDIRFPEMAMHAARNGAFLMVYPGAFNLTTGPLHWELLVRARAVDNQIYTAVCSPARDTSDANAYHAWGYSTIVDPNGEILAKAGLGDEEGRKGCEECIVYADVVPERMQEVRMGIPVTQQRRSRVRLSEFELDRGV